MSGRARKPMNEMSEANTASVHGVPGDRARAAGVMRAIWPLLGAIFLCGFFLGTVLPRLPRGVSGAGLLLVAVFLVWAMRGGLRGIRAYFKGARGEEMVAVLLEALPQGYHVFHDVPCGDAGGIDHLVVGPTGLFVVETKYWSGAVRVENGVVRVDGALPSRSPLQQVRATARALTDFLGERLEVVPPCVPVVCFASNTLAGGFHVCEDTTFCNASGLRSLVLSHAAHVIPDDIERIVKVMEQKAS